MHKRVKRKMKVYAVDAAMLFLAIQLTAVIRGDTTETTATSAQPITSIEDEQEYSLPDDWYISETEQQSMAPEKSRDWDAEEGKILLKIAMAEAEGESVEGKALVMMVVLNRVWSEDFPDSISEVVFQKGQFSPTDDGGRYWNTEPDPGCYEAYSMVLNGWNESQGALYFCASGVSSWMEENTEYLYTVGNHDFFR